MMNDKNPLEGKRVQLILCEEDSENADGIRGHLTEVPVSEANPVHRRGFYEKCIKRIIDIVLSMFGLVLLSPVYLILSLAIVIDDPGPVFLLRSV